MDRRRSAISFLSCFSATSTRVVTAACVLVMLAMMAGCGGNATTVSSTPTPSTTTNSSPPPGTTSDQFLYAITTNATSTTGAIHEFHIDANGALTPLAGSPVTLPGAAETIAADPLGRFVFVVAGASIVGFPIDANTGALGASFSVPWTAAVSNARLVVHPSGKFLFVEGIPAPPFLPADFEITTYTIAAAPAGLQIGTSLKISPNFFGLAVNPGGTFLYATTLQAGAIGPEPGITQMSIDAVTGALTPVGPVGRSADVVSAEELLVHPNGKFLYVGENSPSVSAFSLDANGAATLTVRSGLSVCNVTPDFGGQLAISPRGDLLFQATSQPNCIVTYRVDQATGALTFVSSSPNLGIAPGQDGAPGIVVDGSGAFVYAADAGTNTIVSFAIAPNGALTPLASSPFRVPSGQLPSIPRYTMAVATVKH